MAKKEKERKEEQAEIAKEEREEKEMAECTFHPKIYTTEEDLEKLKDESFYEGVPKGFKVLYAFSGVN